MMKRKTLIVISLVLVLLVSFMVVRFFSLKQSDGDYAALSTLISKAKETREAISADIASTKLAIFITEDLKTDYAKDVADFSKTIDSIRENPVLAKNNQLKDVYNKQKDTLQAYITSTKNLVTSFKHYSAVGSACNKMGQALDTISSNGSSMTVEIFTSNAKECQDAITAGRSAPDTQFNDQFLTAYISEFSSLVDAYQQEFKPGNNTAAKKAARSAIETKWDDILSMNNAILVLTRSPDPSDALNKLEEAVNTQKSAFWR